MRKFTFEQYVAMAKKFNKMNFIDKIKTIKNNSDILCLGADGNWWGVKVVDENIQEDLYDNDLGFVIENEWGSSEIYDLVSIIGIDIIDI